MKIFLTTFFFISFAVSCIYAQPAETFKTEHYIYSTRDTVELRANVYYPQEDNKGPYGAIIIFHGGGWVLGDASWGEQPAYHYARQGLVSIAVDYRLSNEKDITPLDAMQDARDAIRWVRSNAQKLNINPQKIIAYGWSSGAHLAASAAIFNASDSLYDVSCVPDVLILESPAVSLLGDRWPRNLLLGRAHIRDISPDEHVRPGLPPTILLQGELDTVTPLAGTERFYRRMLDNENICLLKIYTDYGHLFTPGDQPDHNWPRRDPKIQIEALMVEKQFLESLGLIK